MKYSSAIALSLLAGTALGQPVHHVHRREAAPKAVTVYNTDYVYVTGDPSPEPTSVEVQNDAAVAPSVTTASSEAPAPTTSSTSSASVTTSADIPESSSSSVTTSSSSTSSSTSSPSSSASVGSGGALGITYSPYKEGGGCKSSSEVQQDLSKLTGYDVIRLYGTDCNQVANVYSAKQSNQQLFLGVFDMGSIEDELQSMHDALNGDWSSVHTVNIGNELVNDGKANPSQVSGYLETGRSKLKQLGYSGKVVAVDTFIATINNPDLCQYSDYIAVNAHAFFDGNVVAQDAGKWALQQIQRVYEACGGTKSVLITESGWPSSGDNNGKAVPSQSNQEAAIQSLKDVIGSDVILYTAYNDMWRSAGYLNVEQSWGIFGTSSSP